MEEHWDADAFLQFFERNGDFSVTRYSVGTSGGERHHFNGFLPAADRLNQHFDTRLAFDTAIRAAGDRKVLVVTLPSWIPAETLVSVLGKIAGSEGFLPPWRGSELMNIRLVCPTPEIYSALDRYFQGTWELPG